jgi:uncharacterized membrane protein YdjX (TVP38/TMEM64 family)
VTAAEMTSHLMNPRILLRGLVFIASLLALGYLLEVTQLGELLDKAWIDTEVRGKGLAGEALFVGMGLVVTALGLPRQAISFLAGYAFGFLFGGLLGLLATVLGCIAAFYYARLFGRRLVQSRFPHRIRKLDDFIHDNPLSMTLLIRLLPVGSNLATNLVAGVSSVRGLPFFTGSALGYIPQTLIFALIGSGINLDPTLRISVGVALFVLSGVLGAYLYRRYRHGKSLDDIDQQLD